MKRTVISNKFILIMFISFTISNVLFYLNDSINYNNMINNGYVNSNAIEFVIQEEKGLFKNETEAPYLLFQYNTATPNFRYIYYNDSSIKLPPTNIKSKGINNNEDYIIKGSLYPNESVPDSYKTLIIGEFDTPYSYILNNQMWYFPKQQQIDLTNGTRFILNGKDPYKLIDDLFPNTDYKILNIEESGTYILKSNMLMKIFLKVSTIFIIIFTILFMIYSLKHKKTMIIIGYLYGGDGRSIFFKIFKLEMMSLLYIVVLEIILLLVFKRFYPVWENNWIYHIIIYMFSSCLVYILSCYILTKSLIKKGVQSI
ncbi:hypothetical protein [Solibacillus cecembensis]|uniref:hypothetical protein n=1 Tax=Solibacillus cecembensis TaxID=459347 RepID=UPI003CFE8CC6